MNRYAKLNDSGRFAFANLRCAAPRAALHRNRAPKRRYGSKAAATSLTPGVRFHPESGHGSAARPRPLWAISGLMHCNKRTYRKTGGLSEIQSGVLIR
jgi:hypothetical protein